MSADEDNLVPQYRISARYLSKNIVAVEIILVEPGPDLDALDQLKHGSNRGGS